MYSIGLTELGGVSVIQRRGHNNHNSSGIVSFDIQLKIININTKDILGPNQKGEIVLKQTHMMKFYFQNPKDTKEVIDDEGKREFSFIIMFVFRLYYIHIFYLRDTFLFSKVGFTLEIWAIMTWRATSTLWTE